MSSQGQGCLGQARDLVLLRQHQAEAAGCVEDRIAEVHGQCCKARVVCVVCLELCAFQGDARELHPVNGLLEYALLGSVELPWRFGQSLRGLIDDLALGGPVAECNHLGLHLGDGRA